MDIHNIPQLQFPPRRSPGMFEETPVVAPLVNQGMRSKGSIGGLPSDKRDWLANLLCIMWTT